MAETSLPLDRRILPPQSMLAPIKRQIFFAGKSPRYESLPIIKELVELAGEPLSQLFPDSFCGEKDWNNKCNND